MKRVHLFVLLLLLPFAAQAQFNETIRTGRPGQAIGPFSVGRYVFQAQTGMDIGGTNDKGSNIKNTYIAPNNVFRFGITKRFEINNGWEYRFEENRKNTVLTQTQGLSLTSIGARIHLIDSKGYIPAVGLQVSFKLPILSAAYNPQFMAPKITLIASEKINENASFLVNVGVNYNGNDAKPTGFYVTNISYSITPKWGTFIENYGSFSNNNFENHWDTGLAYLMNDNIQLDIYGGIGYNNNRFDYFTSIGLSWRVLTLRNKLINK